MCAKLGEVPRAFCGLRYNATKGTKLFGLVN